MRINGRLFRPLNTYLLHSEYYAFNIFRVIVTRNITCYTYYAFEVATNCEGRFPIQITVLRIDAFCICSVATNSPKMVTKAR